ncbi:MAG: UDP-N-acetylmuramoyl-L-alanine--D-glutamate ligase [Ilumatobacteraceae bacterium]|nr:UDP-N-acetylmuramoyl-L-alanine--D-glutamate ligase [Ilumatobacteraceae bacterium]
MKRVAVFGLALAGAAAARALAARGIEVVLSDDVIIDEHRHLARELGCTIVPVATQSDVVAFLNGVDVLIPAPGVAPLHRVVVEALARDISVRTEIDIAYEWEQQRSGGPRPILGVTGTDGKTTTTMITAALLRGGGRSVGEVGNTDLPFMAAVDLPFDAFVVECSSFRLQFTDVFRCDASVWLNLAPDHLDWHGSIEKYTEAKRRLWAYSRNSDVVIAPTDNDVILKSARATPARCVTFGLDAGDYMVSSGSLMSPHGVICSVDELWRALPHDITNSLAAAALVIESGLSVVGDVAAPLHNFESAHHRIELVGHFDGSAWYDDSKATSPHAALTAIRSFEHIVLIAGGRNKDLDLTQMATEPKRMAGVVAIGDDAGAIRQAFEGVCVVSDATSMDEAVALAHGMAKNGATVLLSPGCTSYDWYNNYNERGDDFQDKVRKYFNRTESSS